MYLRHWTHKYIYIKIDYLIASTLYRGTSIYMYLEIGLMKISYKTLNNIWPTYKDDRLNLILQNQVSMIIWKKDKTGYH